MRSLALVWTFGSIIAYAVLPPTGYALVPGPGFPSLESLNITADELWNDGKLFDQLSEFVPIERVLGPLNIFTSHIPDRSISCTTGQALRSYLLEIHGRRPWRRYRCREVVFQLSVAVGPDCL